MAVPGWKQDRCWKTGGLGLLLGAVLLALGTMFPEGTEAQELRLEPHSESRFWIQGRATARSFTCEVGRVEGRARLPSREIGSASETTSAAGDEEQTETIVRVPTEALTVEMTE